MANIIRIGGGGGSTPTLITKSITQNGIYNASDDNADGYSSVDVNVAGGSTSKQVSYFKWKITKLRSTPAANAIQMAEFYLYQSGNLYTWNANASVTADLQPVSQSETPDRLIDGTDYKYCSTQWGNSQTGECNIVFSLGETITVDGNTSYAYKTASDESSRDPIAWTLYGSSDGTNWEVLDTVNDAYIPTNRLATTPKFVIPMGSGGVSKTLLYNFNLSQGAQWLNTQVDVSDIDVFMFERVDSSDINNQTIIKKDDIAVYTGGADVYTTVYRQNNKDMNVRIYNNILYVSYGSTGSSSYETNVYSLSLSDYI